jgi:hypothetical protein
MGGSMGALLPGSGSRSFPGWEKTQPSDRAGELDAFDVDQSLFQYSRAAKELWKFCNYLPVEVAVSTIQEQPPVNWWERGAPTER